MNVKMYAGPGGNRGEFRRGTRRRGKQVWAIKEDFPVWSGALVTAGDVVFYGTMDGWFKARRRAHRRAALAVQDGLRHHRPAHHLPGPGRPAVRRRPLGRGRLGRRDRRRRARRPRLIRGARLRQRHDATCRRRRARAACSIVFACLKRQMALALRSWPLIAAAGTQRRRDWRARRARRGVAALRVCADPNNLPFSNATRRRLREPHRRPAWRSELHARVDYTWWAQRRGFVRNTLNAGCCDLVMGRRAGMELLATTRPYYSRRTCSCLAAHRRLRIALASTTRACARLKIGVQLIGDDFANTPPAHALANRGIVEEHRRLHASTATIARPIPPRGSSTRWPAGEVDVAVVWGPLAGYFAKRSAVRSTSSPVQPAGRPALPALRVRHRHGRPARRLDLSAASWTSSSSGAGRRSTASRPVRRAPLGRTPASRPLVTSHDIQLASRCPRWRAAVLAHVPGERERRGPPQKLATPDAPSQLSRQCPPAARPDAWRRHDRRPV